jgi:hypothetical protein
VEDLVLGLRFRPRLLSCATSGLLPSPDVSAIQEFIRLIEVSAGPDERTYRVYAATDPEGFSPFRYHNETYLRMVSSFESQTARDDPAFLARWII